MEKQNYIQLRRLLSCYLALFACSIPFLDLSIIFQNNMQIHTLFNVLAVGGFLVLAYFILTERDRGWFLHLFFPSYCQRRDEIQVQKEIDELNQQITNLQTQINTEQLTDSTPHHNSSNGGMV